MTLQVKTRSRPLLLNLVRDLNLPEGNKSVKYLFFCPLLHFICLGHIISLCRAPVCPPVTPCPSMSVFQCPACPVAPINLKTHLGSPWYSRNTRRKKPLPHPLPDRQHSQIQALCPLSKGRTPDPAHPLHLPTHSVKMRMKGMKAT